MIYKLTQFMRNTFYIVIENEVIHIKLIDKNISKSIVGKITIKDNIVIAIGESSEKENQNITYSPFNNDKIIIDNIPQSSRILMYAISTVLSSKFSITFNVLFHTKSGITQSEEFLLEEVARLIGATRFGITHNKLLSDKEGLFINLCQSGKIKNTKGHRDENRNRCRAIC